MASRVPRPQVRLRRELKEQLAPDAGAVGGPPDLLTGTSPRELAGRVGNVLSGPGAETGAERSGPPWILWAVFALGAALVVGGAIR